MPVQQPAPKSIARAITEEEKNFKAYQYLRGVCFKYVTLHTSTSQTKICKICYLLETEEIVRKCNYVD